MKRPGKKDPAPPPFYLSQTWNGSYCLTCGRIISSKKSDNGNGSRIKYCSDRCRRQKPSKLDKELERTIYALLQGHENANGSESFTKTRFRNNKPRMMVSCSEIEEIFFQRNKNNGHTVLELASLDSADSVADSQPIEGNPESEEEKANAELVSGENTLITTGMPVHKSRDQLEKTKLGQKRAEEREFVRRAARRAVIFGIPIEDIESSGRSSSLGEFTSPTLRKCEAVQKGCVVEPSFAKGEWAIRWRE